MNGETAAPRDRWRVIANVRDMLDMARGGLADATGADPRRRRPGLMNLITYGRSVTFAMQTMKGVDPAFEEWWRAQQKWMADDPLMSRFNSARNEILKEGELKTTTHGVIGRQGPVDIGALMTELNRDAPPNTVGTFIGRCSWRPRLGDTAPRWLRRKGVRRLAARIRLQGGARFYAR
jgi:hypothetical protein